MASNVKREFKHPIGGQRLQSITSSEDILSLWNQEQNTSEVRWGGATITVKHLLSFREVSQFLNNVMDACFDEEHEIAVPEAADFAIRINVLMMYAGIAMTDNLEAQYRIAYESGIYEAVCECVNIAQLESIRNTVNLCVMHIM